MIIDAGVGVRSLKKNCGVYDISLSRVRNILITHDHADHVKSVGSLSASHKLPVYSTREVHDGINRNWSVRKKIAPSLMRYVTKGETIQIGEFAVTPFGVPHDSTDNVGYVIEVEGVVFTILTDCGHITDEMKPIIRRTNYLVIEANHDLDMLAAGPYPQYLKDRITSPNGHLSNTACADVLLECATPELKHVWLCHLSEENNHPELALKTVETLLRANGIVPGKDFELEVLKRTVPCGIYQLTK